MRNRMITLLVLAVFGIVQVRAETIRVIREGTEWCDVWVPQANQNGKPRVLLVGDSITKGYYSNVASALEGKAYCAKFATSACIADPAFQLQLNTMLSQYHWDIIHFNNGLHGFRYTEAEYQGGYEQAMEMIKKLAPDAKLIITLTTPLQSISELDNLNPRVGERNRIAREMAEKNGAQIDDLHSISEGHPEYYRDPYHYKQEAVKLQAEQVTSEIKKALQH